MNNIYREVVVNIPDNLAQYVENEMGLVLRDFIKQISIDIITDYKFNKENGEKSWLKKLARNFTVSGKA